ncbi:MAG: 4Fe-4S binding protein [Rhodocyclaceae bacterium]|nr:4Fe-4S binding protein [Rhodocyclaceae bacterium]
MTTPEPTPRDSADRHARRAALAAIGGAPGAGGPPIAYESAGHTAILGPEDRIRRLAAALADRVPTCGIVTQALPGQIMPEIEAAAALAPQLTVLQVPKPTVDGHLGRFRLTTEVGGDTVDIARTVFARAFCDIVVDLGDQPLIARELLPPGYLHATPDRPPERLAESVLDLVGEFDKPRYVRLDSSVCAHSANGMTGCSRCLDACPADAIRSVDGAIELDSHLCHGAGGCASVCPTGAIRYDHPQPAILQARLEHLLSTYLASGGAAPRLLLVDADAGAHWLEAHGEALAGHWLPLQIEEIGAAGLDTWLQALARGAVEVVLLAPALTAAVRADLGRELAVADRILQAVGGDRRVALIEDPDRLLARPSPTVRALPPLTTQAGNADKRALISAATAHLYRNSGLPVGDLAVPLAAGAAFGAVDIEADGCTLCNACVAACPVKALGSGRERPLLSFVEERCVQCGLCVQSCPERVLSLTARYQLDPDVRARPRTLKEEAPFECIRCGKPFATRSMIRAMQLRLAGHHMFAGDAARRLEMCADCRVIDIAMSEEDAGLVGLGEAVSPPRPPGDHH